MVLSLFGFTILQCIICHTRAYLLFVENTSSWGVFFFLFAIRALLGHVDFDIIEDQSL